MKICLVAYGMVCYRQGRCVAGMNPGLSADTVVRANKLMNDPHSGAGPRRVLHVHHNPDLYGASRMLLRWLQAVDRRRFDPVVVIPENGPLRGMIEAEGIPVIAHPRLTILERPVLRSWKIIPFVLNFPVSVFFLWRLIRRLHIDAVYTNTGVILSPAFAARLAGVPHVWHIREWFQEFRKFWGPLHWYMESFSARLIAISNAVAGQFTPAKVVVIHDAFSLLEKAVSPPPSRAEAR